MVETPSADQKMRLGEETPKDAAKFQSLAGRRCLAALWPLSPAPPLPYTLRRRPPELSHKPWFLPTVSGGVSLKCFPLVFPFLALKFLQIFTNL